MIEQHTIDADAERDVIGGILMDPGTFWGVRERVGAEDFLDRDARVVFVTVEEMVRDGTPVAIETVRDRLRETGRAIAEDANGTIVRHLVDTYNGRVPSAAHVLEHAETVHRQSIRRQCLTLGEGFLRDVATGDPHERINKFTQRLAALSVERDAGGVITIQDAARAAVEARQRPATAYLSTGYAALDTAIRGFGRGELVVIAGRPYVGKTIFSIGLACHMTWVQSCRVLFVSLEMEPGALGEAALLSATWATGADLDDQASAAELLRRFDDEIGPTDVLIDRRHRLTADGVPSLIRRARAQHGADVVIIDNLHLMEDSESRRHGTRVQEVAAITRRLKVAAAETGTVIIAISHLNRSADYRDDHRPVFSDLRDSGAIEQDADVVAFLHRDDYYDTRAAGAVAPHRVRAELIVRKRRGGQPATVPFEFYPASCRFIAAPERQPAGVA